VFIVKIKYFFCFIDFTVEVSLLILGYRHPSWSQHVPGIAILARFERLVGDKSSHALRRNWCNFILESQTNTEFGTIWMWATI